MRRLSLFLFKYRFFLIFDLFLLLGLSVSIYLQKGLLIFIFYVLLYNLHFLLLMFMFGNFSYLPHITFRYFIPEFKKFNILFNILIVGIFTLLAAKGGTFKPTKWGLVESDYINFFCKFIALAYGGYIFSLFISSTMLSFALNLSVIYFDLILKHIFHIGEGYYWIFYLFWGVFGFLTQEILERYRGVDFVGRDYEYLIRKGKNRTSIVTDFLFFND